ncbi:hypothetical protein ACIXCK_05570 [Bacteroides fragilis]
MQKVSFALKKKPWIRFSNFFFDKWAIEERRYHQLLSILLPGLKNGNLASVEQYLGAKRIEAYAAVPYVADRWELDDASLPQGGCVKSKHQVFFDILYKKGNALYLFILVFLLLSFGK